MDSKFTSFFQEHYQNEHIRKICITIQKNITNLNNTKEGEELEGYFYGNNALNGLDLRKSNNMFKDLVPPTKVCA